MSTLWIWLSDENNRIYTNWSSVHLCIEGPEGGYLSHFPACFICKSHLSLLKSHSHYRIQKKIPCWLTPALLFHVPKIMASNRTQQRLKDLRGFSKMFWDMIQSLYTVLKLASSKFIANYKCLIFLPLSSLVRVNYLFEQVEVLAAIRLMWTCYTLPKIHKGQPQHWELHALLFLNGVWVI